MGIGLIRRIRPSTSLSRLVSPIHRAFGSASDHPSLWGWGWVDWGHHYIAVDPGRYALASGGHPAFSGSVWVHDPAHRGGVAYSDPATSARFNAARVSALTTTARFGAGNAVAATRFGGTGGLALPDLQLHGALSISGRYPRTEVLRVSTAQQCSMRRWSTPEHRPARDELTSTPEPVFMASRPRTPSTAARSGSAAVQHRTTPARAAAERPILWEADRTVVEVHISRWVARTAAEHLTAPARMAADPAASTAAGAATTAEVTAREPRTAVESAPLIGALIRLGADARSHDTRWDDYRMSACQCRTAAATRHGTGTARQRLR
jgi:hypothetical protein